MSLNERTKNLPISSHPVIQARRLDWFSYVFLGLVDNRIIWMAIVICPTIVISYFYISKTYNYNKNIYVARRIRLLVNNRVYIVIAALIFFVVHFVIAFLIWHAEYRSGSLKPETPLAKGGIIEALGWLWEMLTMNRSRYELRSELSFFWIAIIKGTYWISGISVAALITRYLVENLPRKKMCDHILIIGWRNGADVLVKDLLDLKKLVKVIVFNQLVLRQDLILG